MTPVRVLHVLGSLNPGGVETWLTSVLRRLNRDSVRMDFLVHTDEPAAYDAEVRSLGSKVIACPTHHNPAAYAGRFQEIIRHFGPYHVLHSHVHHHSGMVVWLGRQLAIPVRIAHSHNDLRSVGESASRLRRSYLWFGRRMIEVNCTHGLAASELAARDLFGPDWKRDPRFRVLHCGIELEPFRHACDRDSSRAEFGFRADDIVFGHVGRFDPQKNHAFLVNLAAEIAKREPRARFLLVGHGPLRAEMEERIRAAGIGDAVVFAGLRSDVPRLMTSVMDRFLFPSLYEGLGLALVEAQAANLPATISDAIPTEATIVPKLVQRLSLNEPASVWAECALRHREGAADAVGEIARSSFSIAASIRGLLRTYGVAALEEDTTSRSR